MEETKRMIRPVFSHVIQIQNIHKYQDFIKRRYKTTLNFRFTCPEKRYYAKIDDKKTQAKLFKALKLLKFTNKADLSDLKVKSDNIIPSKTLAIFKRISKCKSVSFLNYKGISSKNLYNNFDEKWLRYLPLLCNLTYELKVESKDQDLVAQAVKMQSDKKNPVRSLQCCPNLQSVKIQIPSFAVPFLKSLYKLQKYPKSLKHLEIRPELHEDEPTNSSIECFKRLQSVNLKINSATCPQFLTRNMNAISSNFCNLQEMDLGFVDIPTPEVETVFGKITEGKNLKKLKLHFEYTVPSYNGVFKTITHKGLPLTSFSFSLKTYIADPKQLDPIAEFIRDMNQLESLKLNIVNQNPFYKANCFENICKEVDKLSALQTLSLKFLCGDIVKVKNPEFITISPYLKNVLSKPIKLQTLTVKSNQVNPSETFKDIVTSLQGSNSSLKKLKIDIGTYCPVKQDHDAISSLIQGLHNIRVLEVPSLEIGTRKLLDEIVEAVKSFRFIRVFYVGNIKGTVTKPVFLDAVEAIVKKRGLRSFDCSTGNDFMRSLSKETKSAPRINLDKVQKLNPALEKIPNVRYVFDQDPFDRKW